MNFFSNIFGIKGESASGKTWVVCLGNPGDKYKTTRHNVAWLVADALCNDWQEDKYLNSYRASALLGGEYADFLKPKTMMNNSGSVIGLIKKQEKKIDTTKIIVIHDDIDIKLGQFKISYGRGTANHNGVASVASAIGNNNYIRIRIGIGHPGPIPMANYVLMQLDPGELSKIHDLAPKVGEALVKVISDGVEKAMNDFNQK